jgi:hypothetical protein
MMNHKPDSIYEHIAGGVYDVFSVKETAPVSIQTTKLLYSNTNAYRKENLLDNDLRTACVSGGKKGGNMVLWFDFQSMDYYPNIIGINPGYAKNPLSWRQNNKISTLNVQFLNGEKDMETPIVDVELVFDLETELVTQYFNFENYVRQNMAITEFRYIRMEVVETVKGEKFDDTCISEIEFIKKDKEERTCNYDELVKRKLE